MKIVPNDSPDMELGELRTFTWLLAAGIGSDTLDGTPTVTTSGNLSAGTVTVSGTTVTCPIDTTGTGTGWAKLTALLGSGDNIIEVVRVKVIDSTCETGGLRYG